MNLLAIDAAGSVLSVAVFNGNEIHCSETDADMKHSELVMDLISAQMEKASLTPNGLNGVFCMGGPGSFTGLRIGYSIAKGLALSLSIPFAPVPTLDCIVHRLIFPDTLGSLKSSLLLAVIEARKNAYFYAFFRGAERLTPDYDGDSSEIIEKIRQFGEKLAITGPGSPLFYDSLPPELQKTTVLKFEKGGYAKEIILLAKNRKILDNDNSAYLYSGPEYIRKTDAEKLVL